MPDLYDLLGVPRNADTAAIERAYRKRAQKAHPDRGGDAAAFHAITHARAVLTDDGRRLRYDQTGAENAPDSSVELRNFLVAAILNVVDNVPDLDHDDVLRHVRNGIKQKQNEITNTIAAEERRIKRRENALKRMRRKAKGDVAVLTMMEHAIEQLRRGIPAMREEHERGTRLLEMLDGFDYAVDIGSTGGVYIAMFTGGE